MHGAKEQSKDRKLMVSAEKVGSQDVDDHQSSEMEQ